MAIVAVAEICQIPTMNFGKNYDGVLPAEFFVIGFNDRLVVVIAAGEVGALEDTGGDALGQQIFHNAGGDVPHDVVRGNTGCGCETGFDAFYFQHGFCGGCAVVPRGKIYG